MFLRDVTKLEDVLEQSKHRFVTLNQQLTSAFMHYVVAIVGKIKALWRGTRGLERSFFFQNCD